jgi:hypothetical protein
MLWLRLLLSASGSHTVETPTTCFSSEGQHGTGEGQREPVAEEQRADLAALCARRLADPDRRTVCAWASIRRDLYAYTLALDLSATRGLKLENAAPANTISIYGYTSNGVSGFT